MPTKLELLLEAISPERTLDAVAVRVDAAMNSFHKKPEGVESWSWDDLDDFLACFFQHMDEVGFFGQPLGLDPKGHLWSHAYLLQQEYGHQWSRAVLKIVRTGRGGGLNAVLRAMARRLATKWAANRISSYIYEYWESFTEEEKQAAPREYLEKHGEWLPADAREHRFFTVWFLFPEFLKDLPQFIRDARQLAHQPSPAGFAP